MPSWRMARVKHDEMFRIKEIHFEDDDADKEWERGFVFPVRRSDPLFVMKVRPGGRARCLTGVAVFDEDTRETWIRPDGIISPGTQVTIIIEEGP